jgi:uncharacterized protein
MKYIDSARFCKENQTLSGVFAPADLPRLAAEVLADSSFSVAWQAKGESPDFLELSLQSTVQLKCQRCLDSMEEPIDVVYRFEFVKDEDAAQAYDEESDELDALVHSRQFDLQELIEDEMLMALPLVSLHEACPTAGAVAFLPKDEKPNPFAALKNLKNMA